MDGGEFEDRVERTTGSLRRAAIAAGVVMSGDLRVGEQDAATLLGISAGYLKRLRQEDRGPPAYGIGVGGGRVSYRLPDIARFVEQRRDQIDPADDI